MIYLIRELGMTYRDVMSLTPQQMMDLRVLDMWMLEEQRVAQVKDSRSPSPKGSSTKNQVEAHDKQHRKLSSQEHNAMMAELARALRDK